MRTSKVKLGKLYFVYRSLLLTKQDIAELEHDRDWTNNISRYRACCRYLRLGRYTGRDFTYNKRQYRRTHRRAVKEDLALRINYTQHREYCGDE